MDRVMTAFLPLIALMTFLSPTVWSDDRRTGTNNAASDASKGAEKQEQQASDARDRAAQLEKQAKEQDAICAS